VRRTKLNLLLYLISVGFFSLLRWIWKAKKRILIYALSVGALLLLWWLASLTLPVLFSNPLAQKVVPGPAEVLSVFAQEWPRMWEHMLNSGLRVLWGLLLAMAIAVPAGLMVGFEPLLNQIVSPLIYLTYPVPKVVLLPILFVLFNLEDGSRIALITLVLTFQILLSTRDAARNVAANHVLSVRSAGANRWQLYRHVVLPASLPSILTAARVSIGLAFAALYLAETFVKPRYGIGKYLNEAYSLNGYTRMMAGILAMGLLGFIFYIALNALERALCRWKFRGG